MHPYLQKIWPKNETAKTNSVSESFARLCILAEDYFPEALKELKKWLKPIEDSTFLIQNFQDANLANEYPEESLIFLDAIVDATLWAKEDLQTCLDEIKKEIAGVATDERFKQLNEIVAQSF